MAENYQTRRPLVLVRVLDLVQGQQIARSWRSHPEWSDRKSKNVAKLRAVWLGLESGDFDRRSPERAAGYKGAGSKEKEPRRRAGVKSVNGSKKNEPGG